jgi:hypothetical protein
MATYINNLRLKEITTGDEDGTWGTSTNTNLELITDGFSYGTKEMAADANETFTMPDATADSTRSFYLKITSAVSLTTTREITLGPNTVSKVWMIENATSGSQIITIKQGSGATVNVPNGSKVMVVTDGAGAGAAVLNANPTEIGGTVTSVGGTGTVQGLTLSGTVTTSGNLTLGGSLSDIDLTSQVTGNLPLANGGTGASLTDPDADRIFFWDDSAGSTSFLTVGSGLEISGTTLSSTAAGGTVTSVDVSGGTTGLTASGGPVTTSGTITLAGTLAVANGGTGLTALGSANQVLAVNGAGTALEYTSGSAGSVTSVDVSGGTTGLTTTGGPITDSGTITLTGTLAVANGGTGVTSSTGTGSVVLSTSPTLTTPNLGTPSAATLTNASGLPIIAGTTGTLSVARGGTGATSLTSNNVLLGNGTSAPQTVAPGTSGNVLTSNGSTWQSTAPSAGGGTRIYITSVTLGSAAATITIDNAAFGSSTYDYLILEAKDLKNTGGGSTQIKFNYRSGGSNQTASNYDGSYFWVDTSLANSIYANLAYGLLSGVNYFTNYEAYLQMDIYHQSTGFPMISRGGSFTSTGVATQQWFHTSSYDAGIGSIGGIQIATTNGYNFAAGSKLTLYGVKNS